MPADPSGDQLPGLTARVDGLDDRPVSQHPQVLEEIHRALVAELDALGHVGASSGQRRR
ncbi:MAG: hypothetical protein H0V93_09620 [Euzebyales bacterium]|nr:hypothetical protein [Euzebyales bacterium]